MNRMLHLVRTKTHGCAFSVCLTWLGHWSSLVWRNDNYVPQSLNLSSVNQVHSVPSFLHLFLMAAIGTVNSTSQQPLLLLMRVKVLSAEFCSWVHPAPNSSGRRDPNAKYPLDTGHIFPLILLNTPPSVFYNILSLFFSFRNRGVPLIYLYLPC